MIQNIFIVHTPFHIFIAEIIARNILTESKHKNILLLELNPCNNCIDRTLWEEIVYLENIGGSTLGRNRLLMSERNIKTINKYVDEGMETHLFISDIAWPMNNRIFFDNNLKSRVSYCLFSDGLGTYALPRVTWSLFARGFAKSISGLLHLGVKYKNYLGNQFGLDRNEVRYIYAPNVKLIKCDPAKMKEVPFEVNHGPVNFNSDKCLFLDQPYWINIPEKNWIAIREKAVNFISSLGVKDIYYKNHHLGRKDDEIYYKNQGFNIINANKCAEQIVSEGEYGIIVSYLSSALFNLKCMYSERLRCISLFSKTVGLANGHNDDTTVKLIDLFNDVNVEIIGID